MSWVLRDRDEETAFIRYSDDSDYFTIVMAHCSHFSRRENGIEYIKGYQSRNGVIIEEVTENEALGIEKIGDGLNSGLEVVVFNGQKLHAGTVDASSVRGNVNNESLPQKVNEECVSENDDEVLVDSDYEFNDDDDDDNLFQHFVQLMKL
ncbi:hypothetical protein PTKIN_Ptkin11bG0076300 [Pterospermum kingtungense]